MAQGSRHMVPFQHPDYGSKRDGLLKSPSPSLRGAERRGNLYAFRAVPRLPRFARN